MVNSEFGRLAGPLFYFEQTFNHPVTLMSAMFDTGCILSGSRALEYFVPGSISPHSDWDFYVPGYKESVYDMVNALGRCGVVWHLEADEITKSLLSDGFAIVGTRQMQCINSWTRGIDPDSAIELVGREVYEMVGEFEYLYDKALQDGTPLCTTYKVIFDPQRTKLEPMGSVIPTENHWHYDDPSGGSFSILHGHVETLRGPEPIQLIIGSYWSNVRSCLSFIKSFYASHVQCFVGGWCAGHMYFRQARRKEAILWKTCFNQKADKISLAKNKYQERGYTFFEPQKIARFQVSSFASLDSCLIDYGDMYRGFLGLPQQKVLSSWLEERRRNLHSIFWVESNGELTVFSPMRVCGKQYYACSSEEPPLQAGLSEIISSNRRRGLCEGSWSAHGNVGNDLIDVGFRSMVSISVEGKGRNSKEAVRSGTVWAPLRDATPWSWMM